jgi:hypothetical protein
MSDDRAISKCRLDGDRDEVSTWLRGLIEGIESLIPPGLVGGQPGVAIAWPQINNAIEEVLQDLIAVARQARAIADVLSKCEVGDAEINAEIAAEMEE